MWPPHLRPRARAAPGATLGGAGAAPSRALAQSGKTGLVKGDKKGQSPAGKAEGRTPQRRLFYTQGCNPATSLGSRLGMSRPPNPASLWVLRSHAEKKKIVGVGHFAGNFSLFPYFLPTYGQAEQLLNLRPRSCQAKQSGQFQALGWAGTTSLPMSS